MENCITKFWEQERESKIAFPTFGNGNGNEKLIPKLWEREWEAGIPGNGREWEFPLTSAMTCPTCCPRHDPDDALTSFWEPLRGQKCPLRGIWECQNGTKASEKVDPTQISIWRSFKLLSSLSDLCHDFKGSKKAVLGP